MTSLAICTLRAHHPRHGMSWSKSDTKRLKKWLNGGAAVSTIADRLKRSHNSVLAKAYSMGLVTKTGSAHDIGAGDVFFRDGREFGKWCYLTADMLMGL